MGLSFMSELYSEEFDNGLGLEILDLSRRVAADRWLVRVEGRVGFAGEEAAAAMRARFPEAEGEVWSRLVSGPLLAWTGERNFIDEREKDEVRARLVDDFLATARGYMADPAFPERLVSKRVSELARQIEIERSLAKDDGEDDDGPADFSHLFR